MLGATVATSRASINQTMCFCHLTFYWTPNDSSSIVAFMTLTRHGEMQSDDVDAVRLEYLWKVMHQMT